MMHMVGHFDERFAHYYACPLLTISVYEQGSALAVLNDTPLKTYLAVFH